MTIDAQRFAPLVRRLFPVIALLVPSPLCVPMSILSSLPLLFPSPLCVHLSLLSSLPALRAGVIKFVGLSVALVGLSRMDVSHYIPFL